MEEKLESPTVRRARALRPSTVPAPADGGAGPPKTEALPGDRKPAGQIIEPVQTIMRWTQTLRRPDVEDDHRMQGLQAIESSAWKLASMVEDLSWAACVLSECLPLVREPVDVSALVRGVIDEMRDSADHRGVLVTSDINPDLNVTLEATSLRLVVQHMVGYGIRFSPAGERVHLQASTRRRLLRLVVYVAGSRAGEEAARRTLSVAPPEPAGPPTEWADVGLLVLRMLVMLHRGTVVMDTSGRIASLTVVLPIRTS